MQKQKAELNNTIYVSSLSLSVLLRSEKHLSKSCCKIKKTVFFSLPILVIFVCFCKSKYDIKEFWLIQAVAFTLFLFHSFWLYAGNYHTVSFFHPADLGNRGEVRAHFYFQSVFLSGELAQIALNLSLLSQSVFAFSIQSLS